MRKNPRLFRLTATVALTALFCDSILPVVAAAQPAPPPLPAPGAGRPELNQNQGDPPARVGRIASMTGSVSFHNLGDTEWSTATLNYLVTSGNAFWTQPGSSARLEVSDSRIGMAGGTEFDVSTLDAGGLQGVAAQGEVYLHLRDLAPSEVWSVQTPRGLVHLSGAGRYDVVVGTTDQPTLVTVVDGAAQIEGPGVSLQVAANQTATLSGTDSFQGSVGPEQATAFLTASINADRPPPAQAVAAPAQVTAMCGGSDLTDTGSWSQAPSYGQVWYPPVAASWVPYREGHWAYVAPWGWTWVDNASWGFAPFHYGRWVQIEGRWAWTPGEIAAAGPPVYAPALVTFIGIGAGVALGAAIASGSIGWIPLGPREVYHPWYHASSSYVRELNVSNVSNVTNIKNVTINNYVNRGAATSIPAAAMVASRPVQAVAQPVTPQQLAAARPIEGREPLRPSAATAGVTPVVARDLKLPPSPEPVHAAPGPAVRPVAAGATGFARPTFAPAETKQAPGAVVPGRPAARGVTPAVVRPAEPGHPEAVKPETPRASEPNAARPEAAKPEATRPEATHSEAARPAVVPHAAVRPAEPVAARPEAEPHAARPAPEQREVRPAPEAAARPAPAVIHPESRPEARPEEPAAARPEPRPEATRAAAAAAPHPEARPAAPAHPEQQERKKEPGQP